MRCIITSRSPRTKYLHSSLVRRCVVVEFGCGYPKRHERRSACSAKNLRRSLSDSKEVIDDDAGMVGSGPVVPSRSAARLNKERLVRTSLFRSLQLVFEAEALKAS